MCNYESFQLKDLIKDYNNNDLMYIRKKIKNIHLQSICNCSGIFLSLSLLLGIYLGGFLILNNIGNTIANAKSEINVFSDKITDIAIAAELLVNICNKPEIKLFCKNDTIY